MKNSTPIGGQDQLLRAGVYYYGGKAGAFDQGHAGLDEEFRYVVTTVNRLGCTTLAGAWP